MTMAASGFTFLLSMLAAQILSEHDYDHKLEKGDLQDLKVPIQVCIDYSAVLRPSKYRLREVVMNAMGIHTSHRNASVSYEEFLKMNSFIKYNTGTGSGSN